MRRLGDLVLSAAALVLLFPLLVLMAIVIVLDSPGNPFYRAWRGRQERKKIPDVEVPDHGHGGKRVAERAGYHQPR